MQACKVSTTENGLQQTKKTNVRLIRIPRAAPKIEEFGFRLTRSKWDPYPWVSEVAVGTPASLCGLTAGDCILKVNDVDIIGMRIIEVSALVKSQKDDVTFLCWNSGCDIDCDESSICCVPMPVSLKRLVIVVESILKAIECPVCNVTITPPVLQCQNGHLLCLDCRVRSVHCPLCRGFFTPIRSNVAEEIYDIVAHTFKQCRLAGKLRQSIFGNLTVTKPTTCIHCMLTMGNNSCSASFKERKPNKLLAKLMQSQAYTPDNQAAKLLSAKRTLSFNKQHLEMTSVQKGLASRLTTPMPLHSNELRQMPDEPQKAADEINFVFNNCSNRIHSDADADADSDRLAQADAVAAQHKANLENCVCMGHVGAHVAPIVAAAPTVVNELLADLSEKVQPKSMAALLLLQTSCKLAQSNAQRHS